MGGGRGEAASKARGVERDPEKLDRVRIAKRGLQYALRRGRWIACRFRNAALAASDIAQEVTAEAVASLFGGERRWDPDKTPDPNQHVRSTINSLLWNLAVSSAQKRPHDDIEDLVLADDFDPESLVIAKEQEAWEKRVHEKVMELVLDDPELLALYSCVEREGTDKPSTIAARLNITTREVDNRKRRLNALCRRACAEAQTTNEGRRP